MKGKLQFTHCLLLAILSQPVTHKFSSPGVASDYVHVQHFLKDKIEATELLNKNTLHTGGLFHGHSHIVVAGMLSQTRKGKSLAAEQSFDMYNICIVLELCVAEKKERKRKER